MSDDDDREPSLVPTWFTVTVLAIGLGSLVLLVLGLALR